MYAGCLLHPLCSKLKAREHLMRQKGFEIGQGEQLVPDGFMIERMTADLACAVCNHTRDFRVFMRRFSGEEEGAAHPVFVEHGTQLRYAVLYPLVKGGEAADIRFGVNTDNDIYFVLIKHDGFPSFL